MLNYFTAAFFALLIGATLGLLGGGGSILSVPVLVYVLGLPEKIAIATSLVIVSVTSLFAALQHARKGNVNWNLAVFFCSIAFAGAFFGGRLAHFVSPAFLLLLFAISMLAAAIGMWKRKPVVEETLVPPAAGKIELKKKLGLWAVGVGFLTGLVGAGGGFLIVPVLVLVGRLPMRQAVGTSLAVIATNSFAGFLGYAGHVSIDIKLTALMASIAMLGSLGGNVVGKRMSPFVLGRGFAAITFAMGLFILYREGTKGVHITVMGAMAWVGIAASAVLLVALSLTGINALRKSLRPQASSTIGTIGAIEPPPDNNWFYEI